VLGLRHHAAAVEDFETCARVETEQHGGLLDGRGLILLAPDERDGLREARERLARVGVEIAGEEG
jgi:hypothetical protein